MLSRRSFLKRLGLVTGIAIVNPVELVEYIASFKKQTFYSFPNTFSLADYNRLLKEIYLPAIRDQLNSRSLLYDLLKPEQSFPEGKSAIIKLNYAPLLGRDGGI